MAGRFEERDRRERDKELRQLRRELRRLWRQRQQAQTDGSSKTIPPGLSESPDA